MQTMSNEKPNRPRPLPPILLFIKSTIPPTLLFIKSAVPPILLVIKNAFSKLADNPRDRLKNFFVRHRGLCFIICLILWYWTFAETRVKIDDSNDGWLVLLNYIFLVFGLVLLCRLIAPKRLTALISLYWIVVPVVCLGFYLYARVDSYEVDWLEVHRTSMPDYQIHSFDRPKVRERIAGHSYTRFTDSHRRWGGAIYWRDINSYDQNHEMLYHTAGAMSASNKPHGEWNGYDFSYKEEINSWYWYGEKISEGEWHLRYKR
jgi:hypothetical protein